MTLGQRIQELRKQQGLSQEKLGELLGVSRQAVSKWEGDNGIPELDTLIAMSRLFGVTVGRLLGVEEDSEPQAEYSGESIVQDEDRIEDILRRYAGQAAQTEDRARMNRRTWMIAGAAVALVLLIVLFTQLGTVRLLRSELSALQVNVTNSQNNLSGQVRSTIYDILSEEARLLNTFGWQVVDFDLNEQTAVLRLDATMKEYISGSTMQFCAEWATVDGRHGQTAGDWASGPDFCSEITLPLNYHTQVTIRVRDAAGNIKEQLLDETIYDLHPDRFHLNAYNLTAPFAVTVKGFGTSASTSVAEKAFIVIESGFPDLFRPEKAELRAFVNNTEIMREELTITPSKREKGLFNASMNDGFYKLTMKNGDTLSIRLTVTDNLGRTEEVFESIAIKDGEFSNYPITAPMIPAD